MRTRIITDSASDLSSELTRQFRIDVLPLSVLLGDIEYKDGETIDPKELYHNMRAGKVYTTSQVAPQAFKEKFVECAKNNEPCVYIGFSSELSGTYQSAAIAKEEVLEEYPDFDITIIDTKCASGGFGLVVLKAAKMAEKGSTKEEIVKATEFNAKHMEHIFTVDDLEYLFRGGRVSRTAAVIGTLLNIKPILHVVDGRLVPLEKTRGRNKVLKRMMEIIEERGKDLDKQTIGLTHGDDIEIATRAKEMMEEKFNCKDFVIRDVGCSVGAHSGPGTLAIFFLNRIEQ
ncbi:MAG: DegV family protein [Tissierellales bacterium]